MEMVDFLPAIPSTVDDGAIAMLSNAFLPGNPLGGKQEFTG